MNKTPQMAYLRGFLDGLREYAWWKDGEQQVGTCGTTLADAVDRAKRELAVDTVPNDTTIVLLLLRKCVHEQVHYNRVSPDTINEIICEIEVIDNRPATA